MSSLTKVGSNQYQRFVDGGVVFYSYFTPVAAQLNGKLYRTGKFHSVTTSRHINRWLSGRDAETVDQSWFSNYEIP